MLFNDYFGNANITDALPPPTNFFVNYLKDVKLDSTFTFIEVTYNNTEQIISNFKNSDSKDSFEEESHCLSLC